MAADLTFVPIPDEHGRYEVHGRYQVLSAEGFPVGFLAAHREWKSHAFGPWVWEAAHNPSGEPWEALWRSPAKPSRSGALAALAEHLAAQQLAIDESHAGAARWLTKEAKSA